MNYKEKFSQFVEMLRIAKEEKEAMGVLIYEPEVLGDTYDEIVESLNHLSEAELALRILSRDQRKTSSSSNARA